MVKLYAQLGMLAISNQKIQTYYCGSYLVEIDAQTVYAQIANYFQGRIRNKEEAIKISNIAAPILDLKTKISESEIIDRLEASKLLISATGNNHKLAVYHLLQECSYQLKFPDAKNAPDLDKFYYAKHPHKILGLERILYDIFLENYRRMENIQNDIIHGEDTYKEYYITLPVLMRKLPPNTYTTGDVLSALEQLYEKNCIILYPKEPTFKRKLGDRMRVFHPSIEKN